MLTVRENIGFGRSSGWDDDAIGVRRAGRPTDRGEGRTATTRCSAILQGRQKDVSIGILWQRSRWPGLSPPTARSSSATADRGLDAARSTTLQRKRFFSGRSVLLPRTASQCPPLIGIYVLHEGRVSKRHAETHAPADGMRSFSRCSIRISRSAKKRASQNRTAVPRTLQSEGMRKGQSRASSPLAVLLLLSACSLRRDPGTSSKPADTGLAGAHGRANRRSDCRRVGLLAASGSLQARRRRQASVVVRSTTCLLPTHYDRAGRMVLRILVRVATFAASSTHRTRIHRNIRSAPAPDAHSAMVRGALVLGHVAYEMPSSQGRREGKSRHLRPHTTVITRHRPARQHVHECRRMRQGDRGHGADTRSNPSWGFLRPRNHVARAGMTVRRGDRAHDPYREDISLVNTKTTRNADVRAVQTTRQPGGATSMA